MHDPFHERRYLIPFRAALLPQIFTDVLVIGSGVAGLRAALTAAAAGADVIVLAKDRLDHSNTAWAQGGIAAAIDNEHDSVQEHIRNTLDAGADLCDERAVEAIVAAAPAAVGELSRLGMPFDRNDAGDIALGREGGHTAHRIVHAEGDATGRALAATLIHAAHRHDRVRLFDHCLALDLLTDSGRCLGAITHHPRFGLQVIWAKATILASGGCGQVYRETTNPAVATGDGIAMAWRAGAAAADLEFMQFHPTTLYIAGAERRLITEAVRGEGAHLVDDTGHRFMLGLHDLAELAPRDIVARAIIHHIGRTAGSGVYLDARHLGRDRFAARFPGITKLLAKFDLDPGVDLIPVRPAAHYMIGGVWTDADARTSIECLYAAGEASCTGLHGANRLASNSLLEGLICGEVAGRNAAAHTDRPPAGPIKLVSDIRPSDRSELDLADVRSTLRSVMWRHVGIERHGERLREVAEMFDFWARYTLDKIFDDRSGWEVQNMLLVGSLITRAAERRTESRGTHCRTEYPDADPTQRVHYVWRRDALEPIAIPVPAPQGADV